MGAAAVPRPNTRSNIEVAKPQTFNGETEKISNFLMIYRLFIRIRMRDNSVEEQIQ